MRLTAVFCRCNAQATVSEQLAQMHLSELTGTSKVRARRAKGSRGPPAAAAANAASVGASSRAPRMAAHVPQQQESARVPPEEGTSTVAAAAAAAAGAADGEEDSTSRAQQRSQRGQLEEQLRRRQPMLSAVLEGAETSGSNSARTPSEPDGVEGDTGRHSAVRFDVQHSSQ